MLQKKKYTSIRLHLLHYLMFKNRIKFTIYENITPAFAVCVHLTGNVAN